jgi:hypothetical protein
MTFFVNITTILPHSNQLRREQLPGSENRNGFGRWCNANAQLYLLSSFHWQICQMHFAIAFNL